MDFIVKEGSKEERVRAGKKNLLRRSRRKHKRVSELKSSPGGSGDLLSPMVSLQVRPKLK